MTNRITDDEGETDLNSAASMAGGVARPGRRRWTVVLIAALAALIVVVPMIGVAVAYGLADRGRFDRDPAPCLLVAGEVERVLGTEVHTRQTENLSSCEVSAKADFIDGPGLTVNVYRTKTWFGDAPRHASAVANSIKGAGATPVSGLGDEAYHVSRTQLTIRVSNVVLSFASNGRLLLAGDERLDGQMRELGAGAVRRLPPR
jgi:hypothetical protein